MPLWVEGGGDKRSRVKLLKYDFKLLEVNRGALVVFHGNFSHTGGANRSQKSRTAHTFSIVYGDANCLKDIYMKPMWWGDLKVYDRRRNCVVSD